MCRHSSRRCVARFYLDEDAIRAAIGQRSSFNVVHLGSYFKAVIFILRGASEDLSRARRPGESDGRQITTPFRDTHLTGRNGGIGAGAINGVPPVDLLGRLASRLWDTYGVSVVSIARS